MKARRDDVGLRRWERNGDPLEILLRREAETCAGCTHLNVTVLFGEALVGCVKRKRHTEPSISNTARCEIYQDGETNE